MLLCCFCFVVFFYGCPRAERNKEKNGGLVLPDAPHGMRASYVAEVGYASTVDGAAECARSVRGSMEDGDGGHRQRGRATRSGADDGWTDTATGGMCCKSRHFFDLSLAKPFAYYFLYLMRSCRLSPRLRSEGRDEDEINSKTNPLHALQCSATDLILL